MEEEYKDKCYLYTDGGSRGNPGPACAAYALMETDNETVITSASIFLGKATNNEAEYAALIFGLNECLKMKMNFVIHVSDSQLIVKQCNREWKVKETHLLALRNRVSSMVDKFLGVSFSWAPREHPNIVYVDSLINQRLDEEQKNGPSHGKHSVQWKDLLGHQGGQENDRSNFVEIRHS